MLPLTSSAAPWQFVCQSCVYIEPYANHHSTAPLGAACCRHTRLLVGPLCPSQQTSRLPRSSLRMDRPHRLQIRACAVWRGCNCQTALLPSSDLSGVSISAGMSGTPCNLCDVSGWLAAQPNSAGCPYGITVATVMGTGLVGSTVAQNSSACTRTTPLCCERPRLIRVEALANSRK